MSPRLLLALALLGSASAHHLGEVWEWARALGAGNGHWGLGMGMGPRDLAVGTGMGTHAVTGRVGGTRGRTQCRGCWWHVGTRATVPPCPPRRQALCGRCYRGRLASVHTFALNRRLQLCARAHTASGQVWIGAPFWGCPFWGAPFWGCPFWGGEPRFGGAPGGGQPRSGGGAPAHVTVTPRPPR
uniref:Uncharacterized protein n=1 Tax=Nothoprocta perdicaria TaxID=30464 RepID=A0A8C7E8X9_NOTPE